MALWWEVLELASCPRMLVPSLRTPNVGPTANAYSRRWGMKMSAPFPREGSEREEEGKKKQKNEKVVLG